MCRDDILHANWSSPAFQAELANIINQFHCFLYPSEFDYLQNTLVP